MPHDHKRSWGIPERKRKVDIQLELAIALNIALQDREKAYNALWCAAFNAGVREFGNGNTIFDPCEHEDTKGGLIRGDPCRVVIPGWKTKEGRVLLRAKVE